VEILGRTSERGEVTASCWSQQATPEKQQPTANGGLCCKQEHHIRLRDIEAPMSGCLMIESKEKASELLE
jgi:hypothetical protein